MLLTKIDFENKELVEKLVFHGKHSATWDHYYSCYAYCLDKIISNGLEKDYSLNSKARCILFLFHHFLELCLKFNLKSKSIVFENTHKLEEIANIYQENNLILPIEIHEIIQIFKSFDNKGDGSCWRFLEDSDPNTYFSIKSKFNLAVILQKYNSIEWNEDIDLKRISKKFDYIDRRIIDDLTFHLGECYNLGQVRTQYDETVGFLLNGVIRNQFSLDLLYLPLLFLIRHSLELGLKDNIQEIQSMSNLIKQIKLTNEHSLCKLYKYFDNFLSQIDINQLNDTTKLQLNTFRVQYSKLNGIIHNLDWNSYLLRYPENDKGHLHNLNIIKLDFLAVLRLYYFTDTFITFTTAVLVENGIITPQIIEH